MFLLERKRSNKYIVYQECCNDYGLRLEAILIEKQLSPQKLRWIQNKKEFLEIDGSMKRHSYTKIN